MRYYPDIHHRRSTRLPAFDYRSAGAYFVTICTHERATIFDDPRLKRAVELAWLSVGRYCRPASVDVFVVMPNHVHAIVWISSARGVGAQHTGHRDDVEPASHHRQGQEYLAAACAAPLRGRGPARRVEPGSLGAVVRAFKSATTKRVNAMRNTPSARVWQRNYYGHIIRGDDDLARIRRYIRDNPAKWADDPDNPANIPTVAPPAPPP